MAAKKKPADAGDVEVVCIVDRIVLDSGEVIGNGQTAFVSAAHADNYIAAEKAARV